jgi:hypothetical protein
MIIRVDRQSGQVSGTSFLESSSVILGRHNTFTDFANKTKTANSKDNFYIRNELLVSKTLSNDFTRPQFIGKVLRSRFTGITVWPSFPGRKPEVRDRERYLCVIKGEEEFRLVSPVYKQNIYSGVLEELSPTESPLDFFTRVNETQYPLFSEAKILSVVAQAGQCLFVPAFYWLQSQTRTGDKHTIILSFEYESHSELLNLFF